MYNVEFFTFSKKQNSTARPVGAGTVFPCRANTSFDILAPSVALNTGTYPGNYNYCYIPEFGRYYYCTFRFDASTGLWWADCQVDAMASWKPQIGALSGYVLRSAAEWDGTVVDTMYPFLTDTQTESDIKAASWWDTEPANGSYCVGIVGSGATQYYVFSYQSLDLFIRYLLSDGYASAALTALALATNPELKVQLQPLQFISSIVWLPFNIASGTPAERVMVGYVDCTEFAVCAPAPATTLFQTVYTLKRHPNSGSRGEWLNTAGASYSIYVPPFGHLNLDPVTAANFARIMTQIQVDTRTGSAILDVFYGSASEPYGKLDHHLTGQVGLPFQIGGNISPGYGIGALLRDVVPIATSALSGNTLGAVGATASAIGNMAESYIPKANTIGNTPSVAALRGLERVQYEWRFPTEEDLVDRGRPLCKVKRLDTLPGYQLVGDIHVEIPCTEQEKETITATVTGGYYFE